ncbi:hypothetical protein [Frankia sp. AgB32]|uniref:hypothetical protein n=1 Tax=Frankia sp. AgB32 TaxID=631119 RepID=UPI00200F1854|nr:hypothetical protein [Frankia sp. AgB32]MCK9895409.1 hypothetical protein [Frankia sp. AgB32]
MATGALVGLCTIAAVPALSATSAVPSFSAPRLVVNNFSPSTGWQVDRHHRELGDVNGDHRADIVGFGEAGVWELLPS